MNENQLKQMTSRSGFVAALDQSGGSTPKALRAYGITDENYKSDEEMFSIVHEMRTRIIKSPAFCNDRVIGAILFENTMDCKIDDLYTAEYLWHKKGIVPFLKIDRGLALQNNGVQVMKDIVDLDGLLKKAISKNIFGTKMRSVIKEANEEGIKEVLEQQFKIAKVIISYGLVPIIEPEVDIYSCDKEKCEKILKKYLKENLEKLDKGAKIILKLTIPSVDGFYSDIMKNEHIVRILALSGGYIRTEATEKLVKNHGVIASFSRALVEGLKVNQEDKEFHSMLKDSIDKIYEASIS